MYTYDDLLKEDENRNTSIGGDVVDAFQAGMANSAAGVANFVGAKGISKSFKDIADSQYETMTPESQLALGKRLINEDMTLGEGFTDPRTWLLNLSQLAGDMATTIVPGGVVGKGVSVAGRAMGATKAAQTAGRYTSIGGNVAMNIASAGGQAGLGAEQDILNMDFEDLEESPAFTEKAIAFSEQGFNDFEALSKAREELAYEINDRITTDPTMAVINGTVGTLGDRAMVKLLGGNFGKTIKGAIGKGMITEGTTEALQSGAQRYSSNTYSNEEAGTELYDPMQGVKSEALEGGILGAVAGGAGGGAGGSVASVRRHQFSKGIEKAITPQMIEQMRASGIDGQQLRATLHEKISNQALARGFEVEESTKLADQAVASVLGEGPSADAVAEAEMATEEAQQHVRPEGAERRDQMVDEARAQRQEEQPIPQQGEPNPRDFGLTAEDAELLIDPPAELFDSRGNFNKNAPKELVQQYQLASGRRGAEDYIQAVTDHRYSIRKQYDEQAELAQVPGQDVEQHPTQNNLFDQTTEPLQQNPETLQQDRTDLAESLRRGELGFVDEAAQQDARFREGLRHAMDISPAAVLQIAELTRTGQLNQNQAISALQRVINSVEITGKDTLSQDGYEQSLQDQAARERNQQRVLSERGEGGAYQPNVEESPEFQRQMERLKQGRAEQQHTTGAQGQSFNNGERDVSPLATGIENQFEPDAAQIEFDRWSDVQAGDQYIDERYNDFGNEFDINPEPEPTNQPQQPPKRQPIAKEPTKTPQDWVNENRGERSGVLDEPQEKGSARQQKKTAKRKKEAIHDRLNPKNEVEETHDEPGVQSFGEVSNKPFADALSGHEQSSNVELPKQPASEVENTKGKDDKSVRLAFGDNFTSRGNHSQRTVTPLDQNKQPMTNERFKVRKDTEKKAFLIYDKNGDEKERIEYGRGTGRTMKQAMKDTNTRIEEIVSELQLPSAASDHSDMANDTKKSNSGQSAAVERTKSKRKNYGWDAVKLHDNYTAKELDEWVTEIQNDPDYQNPDGGIHLLNAKGRKIVDALTWAVTYHHQQDSKAEKAAQETDTNPTDAQKDAGNYKKGTFSLHGLNVAIENPKGSERSGVNKEGKPWSVKMQNHYGYIKRTEGADGDAVDVFIGPNENSKMVYIIDQVDPETGQFDEHKVMLGFTRKDSARKAYMDNYEKGWSGLGEFSVVKIDDFKKWLKEGDLTKPYSSELPTPPTPPKGTRKSAPKTQTAARGKEEAKPKTLQDYVKNILDLDGAELDRDGLIDLAKSFRDDHEKMIAEIESMTMPNIKKMMGTYWAMTHSDYKKSQLVKAAYNSLMKNFLFSITDGMFVSTSGQSGVELGDYVVKQLEAVTPEKYAEVQQKRKDQRKAAEAEQKRKKEALENPQTMQDFIAYARKKGNGIHALTPDQLRQYDELVAKDRLEKAERKRKEAAEVKAVDADVPYQLAETIHTKSGEPRYVVQLTGERMGKEAFKELAGRARQLGGNFVNAMQAKRWSTIDGFQFANVEDRNNFAKLLDGEKVNREARQERQLEAKQDSRVTKLREMASKMEADADAAINQDRKTNTAKRVREAGYAMDNAYALQHDARLLKAIADATDRGEVEIIGNLSQKIQLEELQRVRGAIIWNMAEEAREKFGYRNERGNWKLKPETKLDDILYWANYPTPEANRDRLLRVADSMQEVSGFKQVANKIRSNVKNVGDRDLVAMTGPAWDKTVDKIREFARKNKSEYVAEGLVEMFKREDRLKRMGIDGPAQLRQALREISKVETTFKSDRPVETPITKLENEITDIVRNNRNAFNDFFPTDNDQLADSVIEQADIQPGMKVLEPNAGMGHLADKIAAKGADLDVGELAYKMQSLLSEKGHNVVADDFLNYNPGPIYDRVVMNPPFSNDADVKHVVHALSMVKPGGRVVAITSSMAGDRNNSVNKNFREYLDSVGAVEDSNPEGSFKNSLNPTAVNTKTIVIDVPENAADLPVPEDIRFSQSNVIDAPVKGMKAEKVEQSAQKWLNDYDGLHGVNVQVVQSQSQLSDFVTTDPDAAVKAVWLSQDNRVVLVADNLTSPQDVRKAMRHELIGHNGVFGNLNPEQIDALTNKVMNLRNNKSLKEIFSEVDRSYKEAPDYVKAEEVISRLAEVETGKLRQIADRIMASVMGALRRSGFLSTDKITLAEVRDMINGADKYLRRNDGSVSQPNVVRFSQTVDRAPTLRESYEGILNGERESLLQKILRAPKQVLGKSKVRDAIKSGSYGLLTLRQLVEVADKKVTKEFSSHIKSYLDEINQMQADEGRMVQNVLDTFEGLDKWRRKNPEKADQAFEMMHDLTLDNVDPFDDYKDLTPELKEVERILEARLKNRSGEVQAKINEELKDVRQQIKYEPKRKKNLEAAKSKLAKLPKDSQDVIKKIRDHYIKQREDVSNALLDKAATLAMQGGKLGKAQATKIRLDNEIARKGFYVPLSRFGDYYIDGVNQDGERVFTMYQTQSEMENQFEKLKAAGFEVKRGKTVDDFAGLDSMSQSVLSELITATETTTMSEQARSEMQDRIYQMYLESMPTRSIRKQFIHRKGVAGFSKDALQALADQGSKQAKQLARLQHEDQMTDHLKSLHDNFKMMRELPEGDEDRVAAARIMDEMNKRHEWVMHPKRAAWASNLTGFGFFWMIGASPASALINITQNVQVALPVIGSKYGVIESSKVMSGLTSEFIKNFVTANKDQSVRRRNGILGSTVLKGDELKAMQEAIAMGVIDTTQSHDLLGIAEAPTSDLTETKGKVLRGIGWMFHHAEVLNREVTFMTAYRMAKQNGENHQSATKYAIDATWDSHFDYGSLNRARFMQGDVAAVALQFKQYSQNMSFYLIHNFLQAFAVKNPVTGTFYSTVSKNTTPQERATARKQLMGTMAATFLIGGMGAMPVATLAAIANLAYTMVGDENEPWDAEVELKLVLREWFGKELADGFYYGMGTMAGLPNISNRIEIDPISLWIRPSDRLDASGAFSDITEQMLGPTYSIASSAARGFDYIFREQKYAKGLESFQPKWVRDVAKTARYASEGGNIANNKGDIVVADLTPIEYATQLIGFTPSRQLIQNQDNRDIKNYERESMDQRKRLLNAMWMSYRSNDHKGMKKLWGKVKEYNNSEWGRLRPIDSDVVKQSIKTRQRYQTKATNGIQINDKYLPVIESKFAGFL